MDRLKSSVAPGQAAQHQRFNSEVAPRGLTHPSSGRPKAFGFVPPLMSNVRLEAMDSLTCPACNRPALTILSKLKLGPRKHQACRRCSASLSVPWRPYLVVSAVSGVLPWILGLPVWLVADSRSTGFVVWVCIGSTALSSVIALWMHARFVPLISPHAEAPADVQMRN